MYNSQTLAAQSTPDVSLKKLVSKATNTQGSRFNYTFEVKNLALDTTAFNVIVSDLFPVGIAPTNNYWIVPGSAGSGENTNCSCVCTFAQSCMAHAWIHAGVCGS